MSAPANKNQAPTTLDAAQKQGVRDRIGPFFKLGNEAVCRREDEFRRIAKDIRDDQISLFLKRFIQVSPKGYGAARRRHWWRLMFQVFSRQEAIEHYLGQFDIALTDDQIKSVKFELTKKAGLSNEDACVLVSGRFQVRVAKRRRLDRFDHASSLW